MKTIKVSNIWAEDLFEWFYNSNGWIVCENPHDVAFWFKEWHDENHPQDFDYLGELETCKDCFHYTPDQENYSFTDYIVEDPFSYVFVVEKNCRFSWTSSFTDRQILGISND